MLLHLRQQQEPGFEPPIGCPVNVFVAELGRHGIVLEGLVLRRQGTALHLLEAELSLQGTLQINDAKLPGHCPFEAPPHLGFTVIGTAPV